MTVPGPPSGHSATAINSSRLFNEEAVIPRPFLLRPSTAAARTAWMDPAEAIFVGRRQPGYRRHRAGGRSAQGRTRAYRYIGPWSRKTLANQIAIKRRHGRRAGRGGDRDGTADLQEPAGGGGPRLVARAGRDGLRNVVLCLRAASPREGEKRCSRRATAKACSTAMLLGKISAVRTSRAMWATSALIDRKVLGGLQGPLPETGPPSCAACSRGLRPSARTEVPQFPIGPVRGRRARTQSIPLWKIDSAWR